MQSRLTVRCRCGLEKTCEYVRDPYVEEIWGRITDEDNPEDWYCAECYGDLLGDI